VRCGYEMDLSDLTCDFCGNVFSTISAKNKHRKTAKYCLQEIDAEYVCICNYKTQVKTSFERHIKSCTIREMINQLNLQVVEKDTTIETLIQEQEVAIETLTQEKDAVIENLQIETEELTKNVLTRDKTIQEKDKIIQEKDKIIQEKDKIIQDKDKEIIDLKVFAADGGGQIKAYKDRPAAPINTTIGTANINAKLAKIKCDTIKPFTIETVRQSIADGNYSYDRFIKGIEGLSSFITDMTIQDDQKSLACTDSSRNKFHRLVESREWKEDNGATFLNSVFDELKPLSNEYYTAVIAGLKAPTMEAKDTASKLEEITKHIYFGIWDGDRENKKKRVELLEKVRTDIKKLASV
jgi:hypothetical protein